jgi:hypothetical protein
MTPKDVLKVDDTCKRGVAARSLQRYGHSPDAVVPRLADLVPIRSCAELLVGVAERCGGDGVEANRGGEDGRVGGEGCWRGDEAAKVVFGAKGCFEGGEGADVDALLVIDWLVSCVRATRVLWLTSSDHSFSLLCPL